MSTPATASRDEIIGLERSYWDAMKRKDGRRTSELSGETSLVTGMHGLMTVAKADMGKMTEHGEWTLEDYEFEEVEVTAPAPQVAIIAYKVRQSVTLKGEPRSFEAVDSSTWVRGDNGWECHAHSETILGDTKAS